MKKKIFPSILLLAFLFQPGLHRLNSESVQVKKGQKAFQYEVVVTLKLVQVHVTDKEGNPVTDLTKDDFILYDNGKPQTITDFEKHLQAVPEKPVKPEKKVVETIDETKLPPSPDISSRMNRKFILFFATRGLPRSKKAARHFLDTQIQPTDEVAVMSYYWMTGLTLYEYFTSDMEKVKEAIKNIKGFQGPGIRGSGSITLESERARVESEVRREGGPAAEARGESGGGESGEGLSVTHLSPYPSLFSTQPSNPEEGHGIFLAKTFIDGLRELAQSLRSVPGIKNVIFFSEGFPRSFLFAGHQVLRENFEEMGREFAAANSPVHAVSMIGPVPDESLEMLSELTGGEFFHTVEYYEKIAEQIQSVTSNYYVLGYYIDEEWDGKYHDIKVEVKRKGCEVHGQRGYFNPKPFTELTEVEKQFHLIDLAMADDPYFQEPYSFSVIPLPCYPHEKSNFVLLTKIPLNRMEKVAGSKTELVTFIIDRKHDMFASSRAEINFLEIPKQPVYHYMITSLPPGHQYECRVVLRNLETGDGALASSTVDIPEKLDSGLRLYPPLLLIPEKEAVYLKASRDKKKKPKSESLSIADIYPFLSNQHSPLVDTLEKGIPKLLAVVRCSHREIENPNIELFAHLTHLPSGEKTQLLFSVINAKTEEDSNVVLIEINLPEMLPGKYSLELTAQESTSGQRSSTVQSFNVR